MILLHKNKAAFTLIELLIVIAIIAIVVSSSMVLVTAPLYEKRRAEAEEAFETGAGILFSTLVQDAHRSSGMDVSTSGTIVFAMDDPAHNVSYGLNTSGTLVRKSESPATEATLLHNVSSWFAVPDATVPGLYNIRLETVLPGYQNGGQVAGKQLDVLAGKRGTP